MRDVLERRLPAFILRVTGPFAFGAPQVPTEVELAERVEQLGDTGLNAVVADFRDAATEMNARAGTAAPAASFMLTIAAVLKAQLDAVGPLYVVLVILAGTALLTAITCQSVTVAPSRVGLEPAQDDLRYMSLALMRKEAYARLASGLAGLSVALLGFSALMSA